MRLNAADWHEINRMEREIGHIFDRSKRLPTEFGMFPIPACCFVGQPGYDRIVVLRKEIQQIKKGRRNGCEEWMDQDEQCNQGKTIKELMK